VGCMRIWDEQTHLACEVSELACDVTGISCVTQGLGRDSTDRVYFRRPIASERGHPPLHEQKITTYGDQ